MGISHSTARWLAPLSFAVEFAAQSYGLLTHPSMKDVHNANISFFSPEPYFIGAFFFPQQILQLVWLYRLCRRNPRERLSFLKSTDPVDQDDKDDMALMIDYVPYYTLGNFCIATWMLLWISTSPTGAIIPVTIHTVAHLYYLFLRLPSLSHLARVAPNVDANPPLPASTTAHHHHRAKMNLSSLNSTLTHTVLKTFAGIGVLDLLHNGSVALFNHQMAPSTTTKVLTGAGFGLLAAMGGSGSDWIFGGCLVYDLVGLAVGQAQYGNVDWSKLLAVYAGSTAVVVGLKNLIWWPYVGRLGKGGREGYEVLR